MNKVVPTYIEKIFSHPNGDSFKVLLVSAPGKDSFFLEVPLHFDLTASRLLQNKIKNGLVPNFTYRLEIFGVGYKALKEGNLLHLFLGKSVPTTFIIPKGISVEVKKSGIELDISGPWIEEVSQFSSKIYLLKPSSKDKYKQKGLKLLRSLSN